MNEEDRRELSAIHEEIIRWEQEDDEGYDTAIDLLSTIKFTIEYLIGSTRHLTKGMNE